MAILTVCIIRYFKFENFNFFQRLMIYINLRSRQALSLLLITLKNLITISSRSLGHYIRLVLDLFWLFGLNVVIFVWMYVIGWPISRTTKEETRYITGGCFLIFWCVYYSKQMAIYSLTISKNQLEHLHIYSRIYHKQVVKPNFATHTNNIKT